MKPTGNNREDQSIQGHKMGGGVEARHKILVFLPPKLHFVEPPPPFPPALSNRISGVMFSDDFLNRL